MNEKFKFGVIFIDFLSPKACLLNRKLWLEAALGVSKFTTVINMILVTLCCAPTCIFNKPVSSFYLKFCVSSQALNVPEMNLPVNPLANSWHICPHIKFKSSWNACFSKVSVLKWDKLTRLVFSRVKSLDVITASMEMVSWASKESCAANAVNSPSHYSFNAPFSFSKSESCRVLHHALQ